MFLSLLPISLLTALPIAKVDQVVQLDASAAKLSFSFLDLFLQADIVVKLVMISLLLASIWSWAVIFEKIIMLKVLKYKISNFEKMFWSGQTLDALLKQVSKNRDDNPLANILVATMEEWAPRIGGTFNLKPDTHKNANLKDRLHQAMQLAANRSLDAIEGNINSLATIGSSAPFIGLFGTVWGIMTSFQSIAISKNTTLAVVAPGIAEALLATAFGLIAAIPAVIFYNKISSDISIIANRIEDFKIELSNMILRELETS